MASLNPTQYGRYGHPIPLGADQESTSTPPVPPSEEERRGYFHGLPSSPLLVARSSAAAWSRLNYSGFPEEKKMAVATGHAIQQPWNEPNSPLQGSIMKALENLNWTAIDILRIRSNKHLTREKVGQVMMLITVPENSTTFNQGYEAVCTCKSILENMGLGDVEVEMKEGKLFRSISAPLRPPEGVQGQQPLPLHNGRLLPGPLASAADYKYRFNFTEYIGTNIAALDNRQKEGTKGLYLRDSQDSTTTYALTCRHVAYNKEQPADNSRVRQEPPEITQPGQITFDDMQSSFQTEDKELFRVIHSSHGGNVQNETYLEQQQLNKIKFTKLQAYKPLFEDQRADQKFSAFGQVDFSPPFRVSEGRLMDWALVKLAQDKHTTELSQLGNKLPVTGLFGEILESKGVYDTIGFQLNSEVTIGPHVMSLKDLEAEIQAGDSPRGLIGMMHGGKSGFSIGSINGIRSVVRESIDGVLFTSQEWCTIGLDGSAFSKCGDSGSVIFDIHGRVILLLTSGVRRNDSNTTEVDTAYGTPLVSVLHDMRSYGYELDLAC
ncbi:hypothetical protein FPRO06_13152 [Fusarium proliferatum]|nr:hypothetical protein FPRO06_13152 [Fusarium proliferatum]CVL12934.1 uncharacterized protein FPRN_14761 [Fusarium proliferatum]